MMEINVSFKKLHNVKQSYRKVNYATVQKFKVWMFSKKLILLFSKDALN